MNIKRYARNTFAAVQRGFFTVKTAVATTIATVFALVASSAFASSTPGSAIAAGLADGESEMGLVFAAVAVLIGLLLVWSYIKRSAR